MTRRAQRSARSQSRKTSSSCSPPPAELLSCLHPQPPHEVEEEEKAKPTRSRARPRSKTISALPSSSSSPFPSSPLLSSSAPTEHREGRRKEYLSPSPSRRRHRRSSSRSRSRSLSRSPSLGGKRDGERRHKRGHGHRRRHRSRHQERERQQGRGREEKLDAFSSLRHLERELEVMIASEKERCRLKEINAELECTESAEADQLSRCREDKKANELTLKQQEVANCSLPDHLKEEWRNPFEEVSPLAAPLWQPQRESSVLLVAPSFSLPPLLSLPPLTPSPALPFYEGISFNSDLTLRPLQEERVEVAEREEKTHFGQAIEEWNSSYVSVLEEEQQAEQQISTTEPSDKEEEAQVQEQEPTTTITTKRKHDRVIDDVTTSSRPDTEIRSSSSSASLQLLPKMKKARLVPQDEEHVSLEKKYETSNEKESSLLSIGTLSGIVRRDEEAASTPSPSPSSSSSVKLFSLSKKKHSITGQRILSTLNSIEDHPVDWGTLDAVLFMNLDSCPYESIDERMVSLFATGKLFLVGCCGGTVPAAPFPLPPFEAISDANRFVISRNGTSKNAAECAMCFFLATLNVTVPTDIPFFILSPNADSDAVTHQLLRSGRTAVRLLPLSNDESGTSDNVLLTPSRLDELLAATRKKNTTTTIIPSSASSEESSQEEQQQSSDGQPKKKQSGCFVM